MNAAYSFLRFVAKDPAANTLAISAATLVPLMAMVGGGVDAGRYYMTETRLQAACDAGALAARRAMDDDDFSSEHKQVGLNFFDQNYPDGTFGLDALNRDYTATAEGTVNGTASGTLPTSIMGAFGYNEFDLSVDCSAEINISNTDIMFVLDVTGSMSCDSDGSNCSNGPNSRINSLRSSVLTFYDTVDSATSSSAQIRYGIVPYSNQVNVGDSLDRAWMANSHTYQSREADWDITVTYTPEGYTYIRTGDGYNWDYQGLTETNDYGVSYNECVDIAFGQDRSEIFVSADPGGFTQVSQSGTDPRITQYTGPVRYQQMTFSSGTYYYSNERCRLYFEDYYYYAESDITLTEGRTETQEFFWAYRPVEWDLTGLYASGTMSQPTGWEAANENHTWNGCIEEAITVANTVWNPVPSGAKDLDIDLVPSNETERWKPMLPSLTFMRYNDGENWWDSSEWVQADITGSTEDKVNASSTCPKAARKLAPFDNRSDLETWVSEAEGFSAGGNTYHDFGMIWGARFISPDGIFADENTTAPNGDAISRHIVFMTDGELVTNNRLYTLYGMEWWDRRVTADANWTQQQANHAERFQAACRAARNKNISVWVVAFGTSLTQNLIDCATTGRAYSASDADQLDSAFREIAEKIAALRLTA
ncbi:Tad domain-containing protein [Erythrobacter sp. Alg231-14]|uniref:Tad domain-containing protein n=1 Tax=Erythrobacter sp. Alg231-14 TaxID=1922225 RepID=UPI00307C77C6